MVESSKNNEQILDHINAALKRTIDLQMENNDPPETQIAFERLNADGFTAEQSYELIGKLVAEELKNVLHSNGSFDYESYKQKLQLLPEPYILKN